MNEIKNKENFKVYKDQSGVFHSNALDNSQEFTFCVKRPTNEQQQKSQIIFAKTFREMVEGDALTRPQLEELMKKNSRRPDPNDDKIQLNVRESFYFLCRIVQQQRVHCQLNRTDRHQLE